MAPRPFVTRSIASSTEGCESSRFGPTVPVVPASASVWQAPQFATKIDLPASGSPSAGGSVSVVSVSVVSVSVCVGSVSVGVVSVSSVSVGSVPVAVSGTGDRSS